MAQDLKVIVEAQELAKELLPVVARFPRAHRYTLGDRIEGRMLDVIELLDQARFGRKRREALEEAGTRVQSIASLIRLACDLRLMSQGQYGTLADRVMDVGKQVWGWHVHASGGGERSGSV